MHCRLCIIIFQLGEAIRIVEGLTLGSSDGLADECYEPRELRGWLKTMTVGGGETYDCERGGEEKEIVGEDRSEVEALIAAWRHGGRWFS